jgi:hypothetical protein
MQASKGNSSNKNTNRRFKNPITIQEWCSRDKKNYDEHACMLVICWEKKEKKSSKENRFS